MSSVGDILNAVRHVVLLKSQVEQLEAQIDAQSGELRQLARDLVGLDKRVVRIETMIELSSGAATRRELPRA